MKSSKVFNILIATAVIATWVSQSVLDLAVVLLGLAWLYEAVKLRKVHESFPSPVMTKIFPIFFGYFLVACLGFAFNARPEAEVANSLVRFNWILAVYILAWAFNKSDFSENFLKAAFYVLIIPALYGFNIYFNNGTDLVSKTETGFRIVGLVNSATYHAHIAGFFVIFGLGYFLKLRAEKKGSIFVLLASLTVLLSLIYTKTRGALLAVLIAAAVLLLMCYGKRALGWLAAAVAAIALVVALSPFRNNISRGSDDCRFLLAKVHIEIVKKYPLLGIGYRDNMRNLSDFWTEKVPDSNCDKLRVEGSQAHNQYINVAATTGLAGLFFFMFFVIYFLIKNWLWLRASNEHAARVALALQFYFLLSCMTEITFEFAKIRFLILCVWAFVAVRSQRSANAVSA